jgi:bla regulator protein BlaR1
MIVAWEYLSGPTVQCWSIVLLHFVWQGFVIAGFTSLALRLLGAVDASKRYTVTLIGLLFMVAVPAFTFKVGFQPRR